MQQEMRHAARCPVSGAGVAIDIAARIVVAFGAGRFFDTLGIAAIIGAAAAGMAAGLAVLLAAERRPAAS
jgi:hypothetical protein